MTIQDDVLDPGVAEADADVRGYFDHATPRRTSKASAHWYARMIRAEAMEAAR